MNERWQNQEEAFQFAMNHNSVMLDMDMGTGKTRVALDVAFARDDVQRILVVCPKAVIPVWRTNLIKFYGLNTGQWACFDPVSGSIKDKTQDLKRWLPKKCDPNGDNYNKVFVILNYDAVWRKEMGDYVYKGACFDMVILDESHRAKAAGSKVSKFLAMLGKKIKYKMCLSGTPMANSPLDVYGQYRFLDPTIYGTRHDVFMSEYAIFGGPDMRFVVGYKNQTKLKEKFQSIAYSCKMHDIRDRLKLPETLPDEERYVELPIRQIKMMKDLSKDFIAECNEGVISVNNMLTRLLRLQQITSGFCEVENPATGEKEIEFLNREKELALLDIMEDINTNLVVFCNFKYDLRSIKNAAEKRGKRYFELSGSENTLEDWKREEDAVLGVQIQAGAEGVDMTVSNHAIYYNVPHSLALYNQSRARLYRPGQTRPVHFIHLLAENTVDEAMYKALKRKEDIVESIKKGTFDFGYIH